jgi:hypothetical protein
MANRSRPYYTIIVRENHIWSPQFGDYSRKATRQEEIDSYNDIHPRDRTIICTADDQESINDCIARLNYLPETST